ncbi:MAG: hypothetical protein C4518_16895 [Desulfobacteraceae bacterium]|nr:MAG: hypothetical protein C4518_16895 [Desulfobacteraceae bacterium]
MENSSITVEALKKVSLILTVGTSAGTIDPGSAPQSVEFIFGIGVDGLTGFEYELAGKRAGDKGAVTVNQHTRPEIFGHILPCEIQSRLTADPCCIQYEICGISDPAPREIVRSMASATGGCGGGGCDCGCGGQ